MYHSVAPYEEDPFLITVDPVRFAQQMRWLTEHGLRGTSVRELLDAQRVGRAKGLVGLTFDDGYEDFVDHVMPVLVRSGFTATVFVVAGLLGRDNRWEARGPRKALLTAAQVQDLAVAGIEIGSHGLHHSKLSTVTESVLGDETSRSRAMLEAATGREVTGFCYPYGDIDARAADAVPAAGYDYACAVTHTEFAGRYALPRTYIGDRDSSLRLAAKRLRHRLAWRDRRHDLALGTPAGDDPTARTRPPRPTRR
jgi:peptidoglycan/xylan/chitin deacetylase (PgdA/CDA1 family)